MRRYEEISRPGNPPRCHSNIPMPMSSRAGVKAERGLSGEAHGEAHMQQVSDEDSFMHSPRSHTSKSMPMSDEVGGKGERDLHSTTVYSPRSHTGKTTSVSDRAGGKGEREWHRRGTGFNRNAGRGHGGRSSPNNRSRGERLYEDNYLCSDYSMDILNEAAASIKDSHLKIDQSAPDVHLETIPKLIEYRRRFANSNVRSHESERAASEYMSNRSTSEVKRANPNSELTDKETAALHEELAALRAGHHMTPLNDKEIERRKQHLQDRDKEAAARKERLASRVNRKNISSSANYPLDYPDFVDSGAKALLGDISYEEYLSREIEHDGEYLKTFDCVNKDRSTQLKSEATGSELISEGNAITVDDLHEEAVQILKYKRQRAMQAENSHEKTEYRYATREEWLAPVSEDEEESDKDPISSLIWEDEKDKLNQRRMQRINASLISTLSTEQVAFIMSPNFMPFDPELSRFEKKLRMRYLNSRLCALDYYRQDLRTFFKDPSGSVIGSDCELGVITFMHGLTWKYRLSTDQAKKNHEALMKTEPTADELETNELGTSTRGNAPEFNSQGRSTQKKCY